MPKDKEISETRLALLRLYSSSTIQYGGFIFTLAIVFFAEVNLLGKTGIISQIAWAFILLTVTAGISALVGAIYWSKMAITAIVEGAPNTPKDTDLLGQLHEYYSNTWLPKKKDEVQKKVSRVERFEGWMTKRLG